MDTLSRTGEDAPRDGEIVDHGDAALARALLQDELEEIYEEEGRRGEVVTFDDLLALQVNEEEYFQDLQDEKEEEEGQVDVVGHPGGRQLVEVIDLVSDEESLDEEYKL